ncbi:MAG TPA: calcium-binding EGF-like domain-containing protein [Kofleriaceae bacterium]|nr:calcium-binding EGF-like domain-containing protein [Kofleriaceae bacterium]
MRSKHLCAIALLAAACGDDGATSRDGGVDVQLIDAPTSVPMITSFVPSPSQIPANTPTQVTFTWTYLMEPTLPDPTCSIDNGIGAVMRGVPVTVTIAGTTLLTLTCTNSAGAGSKQVVLAVPPAAPILATFTATPAPIMPNAATSVTFSWTYSNSPSPAPMCTIDGVAATSGTAMQLTLSQARTYRLRCSNTQGFAIRDVTVPVNECAGGTHDCNAHATCNDTVEGFTCSCNTGYVGNGDVCSQQNVNCVAGCGANATCTTATNACTCNVGFVGDGVTCTRERLMFVTSAFGTGNLSSWSGAVGTGLAAADSICQAEAATLGLTGTKFVAWMSDSNTDAYCHIHDLTGKKATGCGLGAGNLPVAAGPWARADATRSPAAPAIDKWLAPMRQTFTPVTFTAAGNDVSATTPFFLYTGTDDSGVFTGTACTDWTTTAGTGAMGDISGGGTAWTDQGTDPSCATSGRLRCVEVGTGPALPSRHPANAKRGFVTSVSGTGAFSTWADAQGSSGITAADEICRSRARFAGYANAASFKAWASYSTVSAPNRFTYSGPWYRPDGIQIGTRTTLTTGRILAPMYQTEANDYASGNAETGSVWTGTTAGGSYYTSSGNCSSWGFTTSTAIIGRTDMADFRWVAVGSSSSVPTYTNSCSATNYRLYCLDDSP